MALSAIGEGCHQQMEAILQEIVSFVLLFCADPVRNCSNPDCLGICLVTNFALQCVSRVLSLASLFPLQHPRVRYAACNAIGQMATDFAPTFQKKFHDKVRNDLYGPR